MLCFLGSALVKALHKHVGEIDPWNHYRRSFSLIIELSNLDLFLN